MGWELSFSTEPFFRGELSFSTFVVTKYVERLPVFCSVVISPEDSNARKLAVTYRLLHRHSRASVPTDGQHFPLSSACSASTKRSSRAPPVADEFSITRRRTVTLMHNPLAKRRRRC